MIGGSQPPWRSPACSAQGVAPSPCISTFCGTLLIAQFKKTIFVNRFFVTGLNVLGEAADSF
jgi:hypothetical protein